MAYKTAKIITKIFILDLVLLIISFNISIFLRLMIPYPFHLHEIDILSYEAIFMITLPIHLMIFTQKGLYSLNNLHKLNKTFINFLISLLILIGFSLTITFFIKDYLFSRGVVVYYFFCSFLCLSLGRMLFSKYLIRRYHSAKDLNNLIIVGYNRLGRSIFSKISENKFLGYKLLGYVTNKIKINSTDRNWILGNLKNLKRIIKEYNIHTVIFSLPYSNSITIKRLISICEREGITIKLAPSYYTLLNKDFEIETIDNLHVLQFKRSPMMKPFNIFIKRTFDLFFASIILILTSPLFLLISILIKTTSKGRVFFLQERIGLDKIPFQIIKFRTMSEQSQQISDTNHTDPNDKRITTIGKILRETSLDELPQFINVLLGDMSVVGPRPEMTFFVNKFKNEYENYMQKHQVKAGITGLAQVNGFRGKNSHIDERIKADLHYIKYWSFTMDVKIIYLTIIKGMFSKTAY